MADISVQRILLATDFSEASSATLPYVRAVASHHGSEVYVVHVVGSGVFSLLPKVEQEEALHAADQRIRSFLQSAPAGDPPWKSLVRGGEASDVLFQLGKELSIELLVLGTNGRRGLERFVLGSVAEEIFRWVPCPVLTIGPKARGRIPRAVGEAEVSHILFATDLAASSLEALPCALGLARDYGAALTLLHVLRDGKQKQQAEARLASLASTEGDRARKPESLVTTGKPASTILAVAARKASDLIVLGVRGGGAWDRAATHAPGPVAYDVVAQAPCPVLTLRSLSSVRSPQGRHVAHG